MSQRAVITGMGVVCSAGADLQTFATNVTDGVPCFSAITDPRVSHFRARFAGLVTSIAQPNVDKSNNSGMPDRYIVLALEALHQAMDASGVSVGADPTRVGVIAATCSGPMQTIEDYYAGNAASSQGVNAELFLSTRYYSLAHRIASDLRIRGPVHTITTACSASLNALAVANNYVRLGLLDVVVVVGADSFSLSTLAGFEGLKATHAETCAPFSKPIGMNLGEGAACVIVEGLSHAQQRGAPLIAEMLGFGSTNDAYHPTSPDPSGKGPAFAMNAALKDAGVSVDEIRYINAHGTGTEANDKAETKALKRLYGESVNAVAVSSIKAVTGHCLGAAGLVELIGTLISIKQNIVPPTGNFSEPREGC